MRSRKFFVLGCSQEEFSGLIEPIKSHSKVLEHVNGSPFKFRGKLAFHDLSRGAKLNPMGARLLRAKTHPIHLS